MAPGARARVERAPQGRALRDSVPTVEGEKADGPGGGPGPPPAPFLAQRIGAWRRALVIAAALLAVQIPMELHYPGWRLSLPIRLGWVAFLLLAIAFIRPDRPRLARASAYAVGMVSGVFASALVAASGGATGPRFGFMLAFPLVVAVLAPDVPWSAGAMGVVTLLGGLLMLGAASPRDPWFMGEWAALSLMATGLAVIGAASSRRLYRAETRARSERAEALLRLAEAERSAAVGRLAADVAHRVGNPLAAVKANAQFLSECPGAAALDPDAARAIAESVESIDRVAEILAELRNLAEVSQPRGARGGRAPATGPGDAAELEAGPGARDVAGGG